MKPSLKIFLLLIILNSLFVILASPSLAVSGTVIHCATMNDCASQADEKLCGCPQDLINSRCVDASNNPIGVCVLPTPCVNDNDGKCAQGDVCILVPDLSPTQKYCVQEELAMAGKTSTYAPWYIETPEKFESGLAECSNNNSFRCTYGLWLTTLISATSSIIDPKNSPGIAGNLTNLVIGMTTTPVISSKEYLADLGHNMGILPNTTAYAQGIGFNAFAPVLMLWKISRDISYLAFIAIFVITGFMVMFRQKIDPRTVVTIQEALPKLIVTLLIITFSYAIAGFIIDITEFSTRFIGSTLSDRNLIAVSGKSPSDHQQTLNRLYANNIFELVNPIRETDTITNALKGSNIPLVNLPLIGDITMKLIFNIAGIVVMFKIFFALIGPFATIILSVVFAPLSLLASALPGSHDGFMSWIKGLLSKALVFPATFALLAIAAVIKGNLNMGTFASGNANWDIANNVFGSLGWSPATIGDWGSAIGSLVAFGILFTIPNIADAIQGMFEIKAKPWDQGPSTEIKGALSKIPVIGGLASGVMK